MERDQDRAPIPWSTTQIPVAIRTWSGQSREHTCEWQYLNYNVLFPRGHVSWKLELEIELRLESWQLIWDVGVPKVCFPMDYSEEQSTICVYFRPAFQDCCWFWVQLLLFKKFNPFFHFIHLAPLGLFRFGQVSLFPRLLVSHAFSDSVLHTAVENVSTMSWYKTFWMWTLLWLCQHQVKCVCVHMHMCGPRVHMCVCVHHFLY